MLYLTKDLHDEVTWWQNVFHKSTQQSKEQIHTLPLVRMHPLFHEPFWKNLKIEQEKCIFGEFWNLKVAQILTTFKAQGMDAGKSVAKDEEGVNDAKYCQ